MNSAGDDPCGPGCPIRISADLTIARISPRLFAACYVLHRLSVPRHPPDALLALDPKASKQQLAPQSQRPGSLSTSVGNLHDHRLQPQTSMPDARCQKTSASQHRPLGMRLLGSRLKQRQPPRKDRPWSYLHPIYNDKHMAGCQRADVKDIHTRIRQTRKGSTTSMRQKPSTRSPLTSEYGGPGKI
jgi:hypothetical protein